MLTSAWGIDLGTTNSCIARATADGVDVIHIDEAPTVPSVLAWDGRELLVGRRAANHAVLVPDQAVRSIKRHMGDAAYRVTLGGTQLSPVEVSARLLGYLKEQAQRVSGEAVTDVVITVPAWFNEPQRRATMAAGELAGLKVTRIINEPTAAALAYGHSSAAREGAGGGATERWLVYDLGGGTFDVSILSVSGSYKEVLASCGNTYLGGDDFDHRLVLRWVDRLRDRYNADVTDNRVAMAQLRHLAEQVKIRLSADVEARAQVVIEHRGERLELDERVARSQFAALIEDYIDSTIGKVRQALEEAHVEAGSLSRALLVGGSTRIPLVQACVGRELGLQPDAYVDVDLSVALGAAIQSALDHAVSSAQIVVDVAVHSLGVAALGREDQARIERHMEGFGDLSDDDVPYPYTFAPVIRKNSRLPARFVEQFSTSVDDQAGIEVVVLQGESSNTRENTLVGAFHVDLNPRPANSPVYIGFEYDQSGMVRVTVSDQGNDKPLKAHTLDLGASTQSNSELQSLHRITVGASGDDEDEDEDDPVVGVVEASPSHLTNFLIEQVERQLAAVPEGELADIRAALDNYRELLEAGRDEELDELEERLYAWLDERKARAGS